MKDKATTLPTDSSPYFLLINSAGQLLRGEGGSISTVPLGDDGCMWVLDGRTLISATGDVCVSLSRAPDTTNREQPFQLTNSKGEALAEAGMPGDPSGEFTLQMGPCRLPSEHLADLRQNGYTLLEHVLNQTAIARLKQQIATRRASRHGEEKPWDGLFWMRGGLCWSTDLARAVTHPVALWLLQAYLETDDIHYCHQPVITTVKPARELLGTFPEGGWHSDYPYHPGVFPAEIWPQNPSFGVQYNVCVDNFECENAGTQFVPGSHRLCKRPPSEFNRGGTIMGRGIHKNVRQMEASAGTAILYDSRTWHRTCNELNASGKDRIALLNAVAPAWVRPMMDKLHITDRYHTSDVPAMLTEREQRDIDRLCNSATMETPSGMPVLQERQNLKKLYERKTGQG